ncbi:hypothetical protein BpJC4_11580 [Weizmannia acidilactici]|nr:hypothetical protein BpJC4_11580 [Weizmannia acidilactici]GER72842.1 hypothetical protein BpPP18_09090 [Weizmannia acidilactici]
MRESELFKQEKSEIDICSKMDLKFRKRWKMCMGPLSPLQKIKVFQYCRTPEGRKYFPLKM